MAHQVIYGPPGTGKTRTLIEAVGAHLAASPGHYAMLCSHTKAAATTAVERWGKRSGRLDVQTIHSFCFREMKLSRSQTVDDAKLRYFVEQFGLDLDDGGDGKQYVEVMSFARSVGISPEESYEKSKRPGSLNHFRAFVESYNKWKTQFGYVDFTDMLATYSTKAKKMTGHTLLAIDESQDLTPLHWDVVHRFMGNNPQCQVIVAGDDDQCIYSYTGALPHGAELFAQKYNAEVRVLEQSYRVPIAIHDLAQAIAVRIKRRVKKAYLPRPEMGWHTTLGDFERFREFVVPNMKDTLILYSDRFIRQDMVEPVLMDIGVPYESLSGFPAPLQSKAGQAIRVAHKESPTDEDYKTLKRGLNERGIEVFKAIGPEAVCDKIRERDYRLLNYHWSIEDYLRRVQWTDSPVRVRISTIHGAKGMEASSVHLVTGQSNSAVDQSFKDPDSSHRLFYVAVTRAAEELVIYQGDNAYEMPRLP